MEMAFCTSAGHAAQDTLGVRLRAQRFQRFSPSFVVINWLSCGSGGRDEAAGQCSETRARNKT